MPSGGKRAGAGRKPGSITRRTREVAEAVAASGLTPLEYLTSVYQDISADDARRLDAAKAAAPYVHPKLQPVDKEGQTEQRVILGGALVWQPPLSQGQA